MLATPTSYTLPPHRPTPLPLFHVVTPTNAPGGPRVSDWIVAEGQRGIPPPGPRPPPPPPPPPPHGLLAFVGVGVERVLVRLLGVPALAGDTGRGLVHFATVVLSAATEAVGGEAEANASFWNHG